MNILYDDLIRYISLKLDFNTLLDFSITNKNYNNLLNNDFFKNYAINKFSKEFWIKAYQRPIIYSKPLNNIKKELLRIENFQKRLDNLNINRWIQKDFYDYWQYHDNT